MKVVRQGDIVFSYAHGRVSAVGRVTETASPSPKPTEFGNVGDYWSNEGWFVKVAYQDTLHPLRPKEHIDAIGPMLPQRYSLCRETETAIKAAIWPPSPMRSATY
jgi:putative restriction endonuclease